MQKSGFEARILLKNCRIKLNTVIMKIMTCVVKLKCIRKEKGLMDNSVVIAGGK